MPLTLLLAALLSQFSLEVKQNDFNAIKNYAITISQVLLIQNKENIYLKDYGPYLVALRWCESRFDDSAINPDDSDHTPSWGRYQYKIGTFLNFGKEYDVIPDTANLTWARKNIMNGELQEHITVGMIENGVKLSGQFPACHKKFGWLLK